MIDKPRDANLSARTLRENWIGRNLGSDLAGP